MGLNKPQCGILIRCNGYSRLRAILALEQLFSIMPRSQPRQGQARKERFSLTAEQESALESLDQFVQGDDKLYLLTGYAGTGKTTLLQMFIRNLRDRGDQRSIVLSAFSNKAT